MDRRRTRSASCRGRPTTSATTPRRSSRSPAGCSPTGATRTSRRGPTSCSSTPSRPRCASAVVETLRRIADQCDGVRCDMAMLVMNDTFARTWGDRAGDPPAEDYWPTVIPAVRATHPGFRFIAEAYWDLEWALQRQGFDFCYDKRLYDRLVHEGAEQVRLHLLADRRLPGRAGAVRREPRRAAGRVGVRSGPGEGRGGGDARPRPAPAWSTTARSRGGRCGCRCSSAASRPSRSTPTWPSSTARCWRRSPTRRSGPARGGCATARAGPATTRFEDLVAWCWDGGSRWLVVVNLSAATAARARAGPVGRPARASAAGSSTPPPTSPTTGPATSCATGCTSSSVRGAGTCSASRPRRSTVSDAPRRRHDRRARPPRRGHRPRRGRPVRPRTPGTSGAPTWPSGPGAPCARTTATTATPGASSRTTTPARAPTGGTRTAWPGSPTSTTTCASRSRCGTAPTRSSRSGCSGSPGRRATTARTSRSTGGTSTGCPSHALLQWRYHYPQAAFPYQRLIDENARRSRDDFEFELLDTGVFDDGRYWIVDVTYAKATPTEVLAHITVHNHGPDEADHRRAPHAVVPQHVAVVRRRRRPGLSLDGDAVRRRPSPPRRLPAGGRRRRPTAPGRRRCSATTRPTPPRLFGADADHAVPEGRDQRPRRRPAPPRSTPARRARRRRGGTT